MLFIKLQKSQNILIHSVLVKYHFYNSRENLDEIEENFSLYKLHSIYSTLRFGRHFPMGISEGCSDNVRFCMCLMVVHGLGFESGADSSYYSFIYLFILVAQKGKICF